MKITEIALLVGVLGALVIGGYYVVKRPAPVAQLPPSAPPTPPIAPQQPATNPLISGGGGNATNPFDVAKEAVNQVGGILKGLFS